MKKVCTLIVAACTTSGVAAAEPEDAVKKRIVEQMKSSAPELPISGVRPSPIPGWREVTSGARLMYISDDAKYVFIGGTVLDLQSNQNLSDLPRAAARATAINSMAGKAVAFDPPKDKTEHVVYVFTDTDCGYCRKLHNDVQKLNAAGVGVRYLAFPRGGAGSKTYNEMVSVWCAKDPQQALTDAKNGSPPAAAKCDNPVQAQYELGISLGVDGTPAVFSPSGELLGHYIPSESLIKLLRGELTQ